MALTTTPQTVDQFNRLWAEIFDEREYISVPTVFQSLFGNSSNGGITYFSDSAEAVDIDIIRANERTTALIPRGTVGRTLNNKTINQEKYTTFSRVFPLAEDTYDINSSQLSKRLAGENPYDGNQTRLDRCRALALKGAKEIVRRMIRLYERLAAQSVIEGIQDAILDTSDTNLQYDFKRNSNLLITVSNTWDSGSQTIMADIDGACDNLRQYGHITPDYMLIGGGALAALLDDSDISTLADNRRFGLINVDNLSSMPPRFARLVAAGAEWRGTFKTAKGRTLYLFTYTDIYDNESGTATLYMPTDKAIIGSSTARFDRYFGPPDVLPVDTEVRNLYADYFGFSPDALPMPMNVKNPGGIITPEMFFFDAYKGKGNKSLTLRSQSAPIFATTMTDATAVLSGLLT